MKPSLDYHGFPIPPQTGWLWFFRPFVLLLALPLTAPGQSPTVQFTANPTNGTAPPLTVQFTSPSVDSQGNAITKWNWNFGDGSTSTSQNPSHNYALPGVFDPGLIATNNLGFMVVGSGPSLIVYSSQAEFNFNTNAGAITIISYNGPNTAVVIPPTFNGLPVAGIGNGGSPVFHPGPTNVTIPASVTSLAQFAFEECSTLTAVTIPGSVTSIGQETFAFCAGLTNIAIPANVTNIGPQAFGSCSSLISVTVPGNFVDGEFENVFFGCYKLTNATIDNGVSSIGGQAFQYCSGLTGVNIPTSITNIADNAFAYCNGLTSVTIPGNVTNFGDVFYECTQLTNVTIDNGVTSILPAEFENCFSLTGVNIPASVTNIGNNAFEGCGELTAITVDPLNARYSSAAGVLFDKSQTTLLQCPGGKTGSYSIPYGVTNIGPQAFDGTHVNSLTIPGSLGGIGDYTFIECLSLKNVTIANGVTSIGTEAFDTCTYLTNVTIPASVTNIAFGAFADCPSLASVTIPNGVVSIGEVAFVYDGLTSLTIPGSVTNFGEDAFQQCESLTSVYFTGGAPVFDSSVFEGDPVTAYYLPGATGWSNFSANTGLDPVLWNPLVQAGGSSFGISNNQFGFNITGTNNFTVVVEACTNLADPVWVPLTTNTLVNGVSYFSDPQWTNYSSRYYGLGLP
jgi:PKD repeat protein